MIRPGEWKELFQGLGQSLVDLAAAEFEELGKDLSRSGRSLGVALGLAGALIFIAFWALGLAIASIAAMLAIWLPLWQALLIVLTILCLAGLIVGLLALRRLKKLQAPTVMVKQRWEEHVDWWQTVRGALGDRPLEIEPEPIAKSKPAKLGTKTEAGS